MKRLTLALVALVLLFAAVSLSLRAPLAGEAAAQSGRRLAPPSPSKAGEAVKPAAQLLKDEEGVKTTAPSKDEAVFKPAAASKDEEVIKVDVDLVVLDALVMQKKTGRVMGSLRREDFTLYEDGVAQEIKHFGQDEFPLSVLLLIDRGACLDPYGAEVQHAINKALVRLKPTDEVAVMAYHNTVELIEGFTRDREKTRKALNRIPPHDAEATHCLNLALYDAAEHMVSAGNPVGRRVIIVITGVKSNFDCEGPSSKEARHAIFESGSVVCGLVPKSRIQRMESGMMRMATRMGGLLKIRSVSIDKLAEETGGEVMDDDKPETIDRAFNTLMEHLRTRYSMGFVSTNKSPDGGARKLKLKVSKEAERAAKKSGDNLVVKTRTAYIAPKRSPAPQQADGSQTVARP